MSDNLAAGVPLTRDVKRRARGARAQAVYRARQRRAGLAEVVVIVPEDAAADLRLAAEAMRARPHLRPGPLRDPASGKLVSAGKVLAEARKCRP